jgi:hypothetical protein
LQEDLIEKKNLKKKFKDKKITRELEKRIFLVQKESILRIISKNSQKVLVPIL